ncbi:hypothetical protein REPUB_Repub05bG0146900 [Reevesia pubescens]
MSAAAASLALALIALILVSFTGQCQATLQVGFYEDKCRSDVEAVVSSAVGRSVNKDINLAAALIRLHFHDCFVNGCDASILLDGSSSEKTAPPNLSVKGYDVIEEAKRDVEKTCPGVVSCADIIAMAARDAVQLRGGGRYDVETGRRDGLSSALNVDLPSPRLSVSQTIDAFERKGLNITDTVLLLGGHTIGFTHCLQFQDRLYNFQGTQKPDPTMDQSLLKELKGSLNPPHTHPRSAELLFLVDGNLEVGFVDTTNKLFTQSLQTGDMFIFPKGLVHYQYNADPKNPAIAISAFGSANAGTVSLPKTLFATNIDDTILAKSFKTDAYTIQALKAGLISK